MSHKSRRPPPIECPLASLGHNSPSSDHQPSYHHPLSSSPLNPTVYQRTSPLLNINSDGIIQYTGGAHETDESNKSTDEASTSDNQQRSSQQSNDIDRTNISCNNSEYVNCSNGNYRLQMPCYANAVDSYRVDGDGIAGVASGRSNGSLKLRDRNDTKGRVNAIDYAIDGNSSLDECYTHDHKSSHTDPLIGRTEQYFLENKMRAFFIQESGRSNNANHTNGAGSTGSGSGSGRGDYKSKKFPYGKSDRYYLENNLNNRIETMSPNYLRRPSSPSETSESDRYLIERTSRESPAPPVLARTAYNFLVNHHRTPSTSSSTFADGLTAHVGRFSPSYDQGYATLVSPSPSTTNSTGMNVRHRNRPESVFSKLTDDLCIRILSWVDSCDLSNVSRVCKRFDSLVWRPQLWKIITLKGEYINGDRALRGIFRRLSNQTRNVACPEVERVMLSDGCRLTDKGLELMSRRCPELTHLQIQLSSNITNNALFHLVTKCTNLQHLDVSGCAQITSIDFNHGLDPPRRLLLQFLDLTDCCALDDHGLKVVVQNCPQLVYLYLRRCIQISDVGLKFVPSFCTGLRELSVSDCANITDFGLYELAKLGATLRYLSVAKCDRVSDAGLKVIARRCYKLRYLNARGCEAVSDDSITVLARSCPRLRALDIGKCDVSDTGLHALAESCPNLKKISLRNCDMITDRGVQCIAYYCRGLQHLNIQDCQITLEGYRAVKKYCKRCIIEHTNPGFC